MSMSDSERSILGVTWRTWADLWRANKSHLRWIIGAGVLVNLLGLSLPIFSSIVYDRIIGNGAFAWRSAWCSRSSCARHGRS